MKLYFFGWDQQNLFVFKSVGICSRYTEEKNTDCSKILACTRRLLVTESSILISENSEINFCTSENNYVIIHA
jgi:hypothetical protein